jgi:hypothetical protein
MDAHPDPPRLIGKVRAQPRELAKRLGRRLRQDVLLPAVRLDLDELGDGHIANVPLHAVAAPLQSITKILPNHRPSTLSLT